MNDPGRKLFLTQLAVLSAGIMFGPGCRSSSSAQCIIPPRDDSNSCDSSAIKVQDLSVIDLHCHPSLKMYLWGRDMRGRHFPRDGDNYFAQQIDINTLRPGYMRGLVAAHYLVEASAEIQWDKLRLLVEGIQGFLPRLQDKIEHEDYSNFTQINIMIDVLEAQIHLANQYLKCETFVLARNFSEFKAAIAKGQIPFAHAIEGAHALGRNFPLGLRQEEEGYIPVPHMMEEDNSHPAFKYIRNLEALKARGVCLITIVHFFHNDIAYPCEGLAPNEKSSLGMCWCFDPKKNDFLLDARIGVPVIEKMLDLGIIVDLTHLTPAARRQIFSINRNRPQMRPLAFSHTGSRRIFNKYDQQFNGGKYENFGYYCVDECEIREICACKGVIGVVFENFWLTGCNTHLGKDEKDKFSICIPYVIETILDINEQTDSKKFDNVAIGSDFDGFADAGKDLYKPSQLDELIYQMKHYQHHNFTDDEIKKIFYTNALRVLEEGWVG